MDESNLKTPINFFLLSFLFLLSSIACTILAWPFKSLLMLAFILFLTSISFSIAALFRQKKAQIICLIVISTFFVLLILSVPALYILFQKALVHILTWLWPLLLNFYGRLILAVSFIIFSLIICLFNINRQIKRVILGFSFFSAVLLIIFFPYYLHYSVNRISQDSLRTWNKYINKNAPDFTLQDIDGKSYHLQSFHGQVVLINFWRSWCGPCKIEIPKLVEINNSYKNHEIVILGINTESSAIQKDVLKKYNINYPLLLQTYRLPSPFDTIVALPSNILIDKKGVIRSIDFSISDKFLGEMNNLINEKI